MKNYSIAKLQGLENPFHKINLDQSQLQRPSEEKKQEINKRTSEALGVQVNAKTDTAYVFIY